MPRTFRCRVPLAIFFLNPLWLLAQTTSSGFDYSKEGVVVEQLYKELVFAADGTWQAEQTTSLRVQSDAGVQQFGVLAFGYERGAETVTPVYVRVKKANGTTVETPQDSVQDVSSQVTRIAPMYSDLREIQIPVKALGVGDRLEFKIRTVRAKPAVAGQFWYSHNFARSGIVVLDERLSISVPSAKYVKVAAGKDKADIREEGGRRIYAWKSSQLEPTPQDSEKAATNKVSDPADQFPSVQITTFQSWEELGEWYSGLQTPRVELSPAIQAKAAELTKNLPSREEKERAIYDFVSTKIRYVSLSFGAGKYQPHAAGDVLDNEYGDCKDKHTLFSALLKAVGIDAYPVLIGAGMKLDDNVPSPAQFNHVITAIPEGNGLVWLDTTPEVAPFGLLSLVLRNEKALVIPNGKVAAFVKTTPATAPFAAIGSMGVEGALDSEGTFTGHFDIVTHGDEEISMRTVFHQAPPAQWRDLVQNMIRFVGFAGTVSNVEADNPSQLDKPFHYSFDYKRPTYSDWENKRITPPLFPLLGLPGDRKPTDPFTMGLPGEYHFWANIKLPAEYRPELHAEDSSHKEFADFSAKYTFEKGIFRVDRKMVIKRATLGVSEWDEYTQFAKAVTDDHVVMTALVSNTVAEDKDGTKSDPAAAELINKAAEAGRSRGFAAAEGFLDQAKKINPEQKGLWSGYGSVYSARADFVHAIDAYNKEIRSHAAPVQIYLYLAYLQDHMGQIEAALETLRAAWKVYPNDPSVVTNFSRRLSMAKAYDEVAQLLKPWLAQHEDVGLQQTLGDALLRSGHKDEGEAILRKSAESGDALWLNDAAYALADTQTDLPLSKEFAEKAVASVEQKTADMKLEALSADDIKRVVSLSEYWDTLGWVRFQIGDYDDAEKYLESAWLLSQRGEHADHLGQLYAKEGKQQAAVRMWQLALAANPKLHDTHERLRKLGAPDTPARNRSTGILARPAEDLSRMRNFPIPSLPKQSATADFYIVFQSNRQPQAYFVSGNNALKQAGDSLVKADFKVKFPNNGPARIIRRGTLSCSNVTTPSCLFILLLPSDTPPPTL